MLTVIHYTTLWLIHTRRTPSEHTITPLVTLFSLLGHEIHFDQDKNQWNQSSLPPSQINDICIDTHRNETTISSVFMVSDS